MTDADPSPAEQRWATTGRQAGRNPIRSAFGIVLGDCQRVRRQDRMKDHPVHGFMRELRQEFAASGTVAARPHLKVETSVGMGRWAETPAIAFLDARVTTTARQGIFVIYRFRPDESGMHLILGQGIDEFALAGKESAMRHLRERVGAIRRRVAFLEGDGIILGSIEGLRTKSADDVTYGQSVIGYKYGKHMLPDDDVLLVDLGIMLRGYEAAI